MVTYPKSGSLIEPGINSGLSTQITVKVGSTTVGAIQQLIITQSREISVHEEIGTDGVVDSHPKNAAKIDLQVQRIVFDQLRLPEAFARGFMNIHAQRIPFNIEIIDRSDLSIISNQSESALNTIGLGPVSAGVNSSGKVAGRFTDSLDLPDTNSLVHIFHNCWFKSYSPTLSASNFIITEQATITAEYVTSNRQAQAAATGGLRGIAMDFDTVERSTDKDGRSGRLNTSGARSDIKNTAQIETGS